MSDSGVNRAANRPQEKAMTIEKIEPGEVVEILIEQEQEDEPEEQEKDDG